MHHLFASAGWKCSLLLAALAGSIARAQDERAIAVVKPAVVRVIPQDAARKPLCYGTGFIVDKEGFVVTTAQVVRDAAKITVMVGDKHDFSAKVVGVDEDHDLALLKLPAEMQHSVVLDRTGVQEGRSVLATGYPERDRFKGIIFGQPARSAAGTITTVHTVQALVAEEQTRIIQIDAPMPPGNSGAPVYLQDSGGVIGVVSGETWFPTHQQAGGTLVIPADHVFALAEAVREGKAVMPKPAPSALRTGPRDGSGRSVERRRLRPMPPPDKGELPIPAAKLPGGGLAVKAEIEGLCADPRRPRVYVAEKQSNAVTVVNTAFPRIEKRLFVGSAPHSLAVSPDGSTLYVTLSGSNQLAMIDLEKLTVTGGLHLPFTPYDLAFAEEGKLYVVGAGDGFQDGLHLLDLKSKVCLTPGRRRFVSGWAFTVARPGCPVALFGNRATSPGLLFYCKYPEDPLTPQIARGRKDFGRDLRDMRLGPQGKRLYVCFRNPYYVQVLEAVTMTPLGQLSTGRYPMRVAPSPDGLKVFALHGRNHVDVFDAKTFLKLGSITANANPIDIEVSGDSQKLAVLFPNGLWIRHVGEARRIDED